MRGPGRPRGPGGGLAPEYVQGCRVARLRRWPARIGHEAMRLEVGDLYAWEERKLGGRQISLLGQYRPVYIAADQLWWLPRLDQLVGLLGVEGERRWPNESAHEQRVRVGRRLVDAITERDQSWEEAALAVLLSGM